MGAAMRHVLYLAIIAALILVIFRQRTGADRHTACADTVIYVDTIRYRHPVPVDSVVVRHLTARLPAAHRATPDTVRKTDTVTVGVPISQQVYVDSTYRAWVSGYRAALDSIHVYPTTRIIRLPERTRPKRWSVGPYVGVDVISLRPSVGVSVQYSLWRF